MSRREVGGLEALVLSAVAAATEPVSVSDVLVRLQDGHAYTTIMTTLSRLAAKGALHQIRDGRAYRYSLAAPAEAVNDAVTARRMHRMLADGSDRAGVLARFVAELDPEEERMLVELLDRPEQPGA